MRSNEERFLQKYFESELAFASLAEAEHMARLTSALANIYFIGAARAQELIAVADSEIIAQVDSDARFKQQKRIKQFAEEYGFDQRLSKLEEEFLDVKGKAIAALDEAGILSVEKQARADAAAGMLKAAREGSVTAMFLAALMRFEGLFVAQDAALARRMLKKMSMWTSVDAQLLGLRYDPDCAQTYLARLLSLTKGLSESEIFDEAARRFSAVETKEDAGMSLLRKAVEKGYAKADTYQSCFARVALSEVISAQDKQRILLTGDEKLLHAVSSLPLKLTKKQVKLAISDVKTRFARNDEQKMVARVLSAPALLRSNVCFCSDDALLLKEYMAAIARACPYAVSYELDALDDIELDGDATNVFLKGIKEKEKNLVLVFVPADCPSNKTEAFASFFDSERRARFKVKSYNVELDLSAANVVMFAEGGVKNVFRDRATTINLAPLSDAEKKALLSEVAAELADSYDIGDGLILSDGALARLAGMQLEEGIKTLETVALRAVIDGASEITEDRLLSCCDEARGSASSFGFGRKL